MASKQVAKLQGASLVRGVGHTPGGAAALAVSGRIQKRRVRARPSRDFDSRGPGVSPQSSGSRLRLAVAGPVVITIP